MQPLPPTNKRPTHKSIPKHHKHHPSQTCCCKILISRESIVDEKRTEGNIPNAVQTCKSTRELSALWFCRDWKFDELEHAFGFGYSEEAEEAWDDGEGY
ncbi:hypothetical protein FIE12Z_5189 [Fusarium flagelliforme]|uniref:Uncharacterized protein n=1 Tax=Fusarium flagelliforme TaxID=2675880 RepID=A0A395MT18_9HYPO|nr:hypothetical protein FIE12Z_5189 [Fusarium flagelliforme]